MGLKTTASNVNDEASRRNSHIDRLLKAEKGAARKTTTVLLLGAYVDDIKLWEGFLTEVEP